MPFDAAPSSRRRDCPSRPESMYALTKRLEEELASKLVRWDPPRASRRCGSPTSWCRRTTRRSPAFDADPRHPQMEPLGLHRRRAAPRRWAKALELHEPGFETYIIAAEDTVMTRSSASLAAEVFPEVEVRRTLRERRTAVDRQGAKGAGYDPQHSWRDHASLSAPPGFGSRQAADANRRRGPRASGWPCSPWRSAPCRRRADAAPVPEQVGGIFATGLVPRLIDLYGPDAGSTADAKAGQIREFTSGRSRSWPELTTIPTQLPTPGWRRSSSRTSPWGWRSWINPATGPARLADFTVGSRIVSALAARPAEATLLLAKRKGRVRADRERDDPARHRDLRRARLRRRCRTTKPVSRVGRTSAGPRDEPGTAHRRHFPRCHRRASRGFVVLPDRRRSTAESTAPARRKRSGPGRHWESRRMRRFAEVGH